MEILNIEKTQKKGSENVHGNIGIILCLPIISSPFAQRIVLVYLGISKMGKCNYLLMDKSLRMK